MKRFLIILFFFASSLSLYANGTIPEGLHMALDFQAIGGNGVGQKDGAPYIGGGFAFHGKIDYTFWNVEKASGALSAGVQLTLLAANDAFVSVVGENSGLDSNLSFLVDEYLPSLNFSLGHTFSFLDDRNLFLGIYGLFGYAWKIEKSRLNENDNAYFNPSSVPTEAFLQSSTANVAIMVDLGYNFHENVGVVTSGTYIVPISPGVTGNFILGIGLRVNPF